MWVCGSLSLRVGREEGTGRGAERREREEGEGTGRTGKRKRMPWLRQSEGGELRGRLGAQGREGGESREGAVAEETRSRSPSLARRRRGREQGQGSRRSCPWERKCTGH